MHFAIPLMNFSNFQKFSGVRGGGHQPCTLYEISLPWNQNPAGALHEDTTVCSTVIRTEMEFFKIRNLNMKTVQMEIKIFAHVARAVFDHWKMFV